MYCSEQPFNYKFYCIYYFYILSKGIEKQNVCIPDSIESRVSNVLSRKSSKEFRNILSKNDLNQMCCNLVLSK